MPNRNVHTVHSENGWTNRYENSNRAWGYYDTKAEEKAIQNNSEHIIHGLNGRIQNKNSYGSDSMPTKR